MGPKLLAVVGCIYLAVAYDYYRHGKNGMCLAFIAYALANVGFIIASWRNE